MRLFLFKQGCMSYIRFFVFAQGYMSLYEVVRAWAELYEFV